MKDYVSLVDNLRQKELTVQPAGEVSQPFFSVKGQVLKVNGNDVQVFEYPDETAAQGDAQKVKPDGYQIGTSMVSWMAPPHFYRTGRIIVLYVGEDAQIKSAMEGVVGPQFAGKR